MIIRRARPTDYPAILQLQGKTCRKRSTSAETARDLSYRA